MKVQRGTVTTLQVLLACHTFHSYGGMNPVDRIMKDSQVPEKVVLAAMERDEDKGYIESGVSLRTAWVTDEGKKYLLNWMKAGGQNG